MANKDTNEEKKYIDEETKNIFKNCPEDLKLAGIQFIGTLHNYLTAENGIHSITIFTSIISMFFGLLPKEMRSGVKKVIVLTLDLTEKGALPNMERYQKMKEDGTWDKVKKELKDDGII